MIHKSTRRSFLGTSIALAAGSAIPTLAHPATTPAAPVQLGLASYTFRDFKRSQLIGFMAQLKLDALNAKNVLDHLPADPGPEAAALAEYAAAGINLHAAGTIDFSNIDSPPLRDKLDYCKRAGIKVIVAGDPRPEDLPRIEKMAAEYDVRIAIHNHGPEDKVWHSPLDVLRAVRGLGDRIGCCMDVGHAARAGTDVVSAIHQAGPRLFNMHIKDLANFEHKDSQVAVGDGIMPIHQIFGALMHIRYAGFVDLEYEINAEDPMPGVTRSFAYMRGVLAGMGSAV